MAKITAEQPLVASVLDRLLDEEPAVKREAPKSRHQVLRELKQAVRRDLENLLNTRRRCLPWPADLKELEQSLVNYGVLDFTGAHISSAERDQLRQALVTVIRTFEPRFVSVKVNLLNNADPLDRTFRFRIDALMYADPAPEPVVFDSTLEPGTGTFQVKGSTG